MMRRALAPFVAGLLVLAACGGDDSSTGKDDESSSSSGASTGSSDDTVASEPVGSDTGSSDTRSTGAGPEATLPEPADVLTPPVDPTEVIGDDVGESLAALQFPRGWILPSGGRADVVGALVRYSRGESAVYATFRTGYVVPAGDPEAVAEEWAKRFAASLGLEGIERLGTIKNDTSESVEWSTPGDAEAGAPELDVSVSHPVDDPTAAMTLTAELQSVDGDFPDLVMPLDFDPTLPPLSGCTVNRFDVNYDGYDLPNDTPEDPNYTLWWEGVCPGLDTFDLAGAWANDNGREVNENTTSFGVEVTSEDDITVKLNARRTDDGNSALTLIVVQPFGGEA